MRRILLSLAFALLASHEISAQEKTRFSHADSVRGMNSPQRSWWDVSFYDLHVSVNPSDSTIRGYNGITYRVLRPATEMQIDLQTPMVVDSMVQDGKALTFTRDSNAFFVTLPAAPARASMKTIAVYYHGRPRLARLPPWDGGFGWSTDSLGRLYLSTTNEGLGASVWWPTKDIPSDEPDSQRIAITMPDPTIDVSNGRLRSTIKNADGTSTYEWFVKNPINNYDVAINAGGYEHFSDVYKGEAGDLTLDFYPLSYHLDAAKQQFAQVKPMLACFEKWFGPYPWYADGYKLVETAHLGMEHQSAVAYGNLFHNGYRRATPQGNQWVDLSHTGLGLEWDFIIVHESAHEWWGNNISAADHADMWIHESFANYAESLFEECQKGKEAGAKYVIGVRANVTNNAPVIGHYGVNNEGSGDMYYKGGNMLHTIRQIIHDDTKWRSILRGLNTTFRHSTVSGRDVEDYINTHSGINLDKVFTQYLMTTRIPNFEYDIQSGVLWYRWTNVIPGFDMPIRAHTMEGPDATLHPTEKWQKLPLDISADSFKLDENFYVNPVKVIH
jgi:aminopeptidase N